MTNGLGNESKTADEVHQAEPLAAWMLPSMDGLKRVLLLRLGFLSSCCCEEITMVIILEVKGLTPVIGAWNSM